MQLVPAYLLGLAAQFLKAVVLRLKKGKRLTGHWPSDLGYVMMIGRFTGCGIVNWGEHPIGFIATPDQQKDQNDPFLLLDQQFI